MTTPVSRIRQYLFLVAVTLLCCLRPEANAQDVATSTEDWHMVTVPDAWRNMPSGKLQPINGYSWYRCLVQVPESWHGADLTLFAEALDDAQGSYINGINVGATGTFPPHFRSGLGEAGR